MEGDSMLQTQRVSNPGAMPQWNKKQPVSERAQAFKEDLRRLCKKYDLAIRGQIPESVLIVYDVDAIRERGARARYMPEAYSQIDVSRL